MGRFGSRRTGWSALSRRRQVALISTVAMGAVLIAAGVEAASDPTTPPPVVWRDHVADPTSTSTSTTSTSTTSTSTTSTSTTSTSMTAPPAGPGSGDPLAGLRVAAEGPRSGYQRDLFGNWIDADRDRCDTREEVLQAQSTTPPQTDYSGTSCKVIAGDWLSLYDGVVLTDRTEVEIDHVVALAEAWDSGASAWDHLRRRAFANDLSSPELLAVSSPSNQSKSDRDPAEWAPPRAEAHCRFASYWIAVKKAWDLSADPAEVVALRRMLATCPATIPV